MGIKIGNLDISYFKVGGDDCSIYLGDTLLYPQATPSYKFIGQYSDTTEYKVECDGGTALTQTMISNSGKEITSLKSAEIRACGQATFKIGDNAFSGATNLSSVTIDNGVTQLGIQSFMYCSGITSFTFPSNLERIDGACFRYANSITSLNVPNGLTYLGTGCFADMAGLTAATLPSTLTGTSNNLFLRDSSLKNVHFLGRTAPALGVDAFKSSGIEKIYIPDCNCYESYASTAGMSAYTNYIYGEDGTKCKAESYPYVIKRTSRGNSAYTMACTSTSASTVTSANTRSGITAAQITGSTQKQTPVSIIFGDCAKTLNNGICSGWTYLTSITISNRVTSIGQNAFKNCYRVSKLDIGSGVTSFNNTAAFGFIGTSASTAPNLSITNKSTVIFSNSCFQYSKLGNVNFNCRVSISSNAFGHATITSLKFYSGSILNGDTSSSAFNNATIGTLNLGSISSIGDCAFYNAKGFKTLTIPSSVTNLGDNAFIGTSLTALTLDYSSNCTVGDYTFSSLSGLKTVNITDRVASIGIDAFRDCSNLTSITVNRTTPPSLGESAFYGSTCPIYVPASAVNTYKSDSGWSSYADRIQAIS